MAIGEKRSQPAFLRRKSYTIKSEVSAGIKSNGALSAGVACLQLYPFSPILRLPPPFIITFTHPSPPTKLLFSSIDHSTKFIPHYRFCEQDLPLYTTTCLPVQIHQRRQRKDRENCVIRLNSCGQSFQFCLRRFIKKWDY